MRLECWFDSVSLWWCLLGVDRPGEPSSHSHFVSFALCFFMAFSVFCETSRRI
jgi:hypothetical protein